MCNLFMFKRLYISLVFSCLVVSKQLSTIIVDMRNFVAKFRKILEICKIFAGNQVDERGNVTRRLEYGVSWNHSKPDYTSAVQPTSQKDDVTWREHTLGHYGCRRRRRCFQHRFQSWQVSKCVRTHLPKDASLSFLYLMIILENTLLCQKGFWPFRVDGYQSNFLHYVY